MQKLNFDSINAPYSQDLGSVDSQSLKASVPLFYFDFYCYPSHEQKNPVVDLGPSSVIPLELLLRHSGLEFLSVPLKSYENK